SAQPLKRPRGVVGRALRPWLAALRAGTQGPRLAQKATGGLYVPARNASENGNVAPFRQRAGTLCPCAQHS
ncbi:MAG: hypothetical protein LAT55_13345, partial [Opitutales bacterium]|nr:hypothetical protein [Opitutales bacterium]